MVKPFTTTVTLCGQPVLAPYAGTVRFGTARWGVGYPKIALGATLFPFNVHRAAAMGGYDTHAGGGNFVFGDEAFALSLSPSQ